MGYNQMMEAFSSGDMGVIIPDGVICSLPIIGRHENKPVDMFFTYVISREGELSHPRTVYVIDPNRVQLEREQLASDVDASCTEEMLSSKSTADFRTAVSIRKRYIELYDIVYDIAFQSDLSQKATDSVQEFISTFKNAIEPAHEPFYKKLAPEFFEWATKALS